MLAVVQKRRAFFSRIVDDERRTFVPRRIGKVLADKKRKKRILRRRRRRKRTPFEIVQVVVVRGEVEGQQVTTSRG